MSTFQALHEVIGERAVLLALHRPGSHYWHTPAAGGNRQGQPDPGGPALAQPDRADRGLFARGAGALGADPAEAPAQELAGGITTMEDANRYLKEVFWPAHNRRFARPAEASGSAFVAFATLADILGVRSRQHGARTTTSSGRPRCLARYKADSTLVTRFDHWWRLLCKRITREGTGRPVPSQDGQAARGGGGIGQRAHGST